MDPSQNLLRRLPAIDRLLNEPPLLEIVSVCPHLLLVESAQEAVEQLRHAILHGKVAVTENDLAPAVVAAAAAHRAKEKLRPSLRPLINATGTVLHTNLGRAPLSKAALAAVSEVSRAYSNLEFDLVTGERGHRYAHVEALLCRLTGAEAATVVNNNAGAVLLALDRPGAGEGSASSRAANWSRSAAAFRIPEVMASRRRVSASRSAPPTRPTSHDYRAAIGTGDRPAPQGPYQQLPDCRLHQPPYRRRNWSPLGREHGLPVLEDLGSGMLIDLTPFGLPREADGARSGGHRHRRGHLQRRQAARRAAGRADRRPAGRPSRPIRRHPLARALRLDKMTLAALEATLAPLSRPGRSAARDPAAAHARRHRRTNCDAAASACCRSCKAAAQATGPHRCRRRKLPPSAAAPCRLAELPGFAIAVTPQPISVATAGRPPAPRPPAGASAASRTTACSSIRAPCCRSEETALVAALAAGPGRRPSDGR